MFCRNCGKELEGAPESCTNCGAKPMAGISFCPQCGAPTTPLAETCTGCGVRLDKAIQGKTWKTKAAGVLAIVAGAAGLTQWVTIAAVEIPYWGWVPMGGGVIGAVAAMVVALEIAAGIIAVMGGAFALRRKRWRLALAGGICSFFSFFLFFLNTPLAIAAIILLVLGKREFE